MGSFRDIVRSQRGRSGRIDEFTLGLAIAPAADAHFRPYTLLTTFCEEGSQPVVSSFRFEFESNSFLEIQRNSDKTIFKTPGDTVSSDVPFNEASLLLDFMVTGHSGVRKSLEYTELRPIVDYLMALFARSGSTRQEHFGMYSSFLQILSPDFPELLPVAPLRSKPKRTYDPVRETASPEGEHIPMLMMRLNRTNKRHWNALHDDLVAFGDGSGLFSDIKVKRHGGQMSDPFQLQVKVRSGPHANIMDVGYGVTQSLPILVDVMTEDQSPRRRSRRSGDTRTFLLQQPEVHLHPRGQAELANLFIEAFSKRGSRFLIETHSDYIIDRVRISVRQGKLKPEDVSILYFEPNGNAVTIHSMTLDGHGNLQNAPAKYRDFFVRETDTLLGFAD